MTSRAAAPKHPPFTPVKSSMISSVGYDSATRTLHVKFPNGGHYVYEGVTPEQHADLVGAGSIGKHFAQNVRGRFKHRMLPTEGRK